MSLWAQSDKRGPGSQRRELPNQPESDLRDRIRLPPLPRLGRCCPPSIRIRCLRAIYNFSDGEVRIGIFGMTNKEAILLD